MSESIVNPVKLTWYLPDGPHVMQPDEYLVFDCINDRVYITDSPPSSSRGTA